MEQRKTGKIGCWHDIQSRSKKKYSIIKQSRAATGGGEQNTEVLTEHEEQVLNTMYSTSIEGHPDIEESIINILSDTEDDAMQVEYLEEYEDVLNFTEKKQDKIEIQKKQIATCTHSDNNRNMLFLQKNKATINSNKLSNNKENINKNNNVEKQPSFEISKALGKSMNTSSCEQNKTTTEKKRMTKRELLNTVEVSTNLNSIYEQTYELKKQYYEARLEYLKRSVETQEKMATILEKCNENLINITDKCNMS
ncbi:uncharacterized protein LOC105199862 isoform X2 [Solenopsis invicta]|uniref:uncharacterized protein LOC105199862 isoform X2 n=1 Tax=Solenopsis invicta TaxID=13686 RepID=UPI00193D9730|nr:uncharacterized protein LOC105199862 isoform X2 [Solenopsis invicta]